MPSIHSLGFEPAFNTERVDQKHRIFINEMSQETWNLSTNVIFVFRQDTRIKDGSYSSWSPQKCTLQKYKLFQLKQHQLYLQNLLDSLTIQLPTCTTMHPYANITIHHHYNHEVPILINSFKSQQLYTSTNKIMVIAYTICNNMVTQQTKILYISPKCTGGSQWLSRSHTHAHTHTHTHTHKYITCKYNRYEQKCVQDKE